MTVSTVGSTTSGAPAMTYNGFAPGRLQGLDLRPSLHLGGLSDFSKAVVQQVGVDKGFVGETMMLKVFKRNFVCYKTYRFVMFSGCISQLKISGNNERISPGLVANKVGVTGCETCAVNPCQNGGVCQGKLVNQGFK